MEDLNFIDKIRESIESDDLIAKGRDVNELRSKFDDYVLEEERKIQVEEIKASEAEAQIDSSVLHRKEEIAQLKDSFYELYGEFKNKKHAVLSAIKEEESKNLAEKNALIKRLQEVVSGEENIGSAFASLKEIQEKWKTVGDIPRDKRNDIQTTYSRLLEDFFYNIKIYKELKDHDFHRNEQLKTELIEELKKLNQLKSIKEVESQLKQLQNDWNDIGPVPNEAWEALKESYWTEVKSIYNRIHRFYDDRRAQQQKNLELKRELLNRSTVISQTVSELKSTKDWEAKTKELIAIQKEWKTIGFGPKKENDQIWKDFRGVCDHFFDAKKAFYKIAQGEFDLIAEKKKKIIERAAELKNSSDWNETASALKRLQNEWRKAGHSGVKHEQKLWKEFRGICDAFFNARQKHFEQQEKAFEENFGLKQALLKTIKAYKPADQKEGLEQLKSFANEFAAIGMVPREHKDSIYESYKVLMDEKYQALNLDSEEQEKIMFEAKIDTIKAAGNSSAQFSNLKSSLRKEIDKYNKEIVQLENNLGFFANSKGANALKEEVEGKISILKEKINAIKSQLKLIPNE